MSGKREKDRKSGTGRPIKPIAKKDGSGQGNWGSHQQEIDQGKYEHQSSQQNNLESIFIKRGKGNQYENNDLNPKQSQKELTSWDDYQKQKGKTKPTQYKDNSAQMKKIKREHAFKKKYKPNKFERETDKLFAGENKKKNKNRR